uniref:Putative CMP/dCMP deaminase zinc-binding n=2 Tax=viral metagenome TaxID=1070528 RepID=A0A6M3JRY3_9ZZZZ
MEEHTSQHTKDIHYMKVAKLFMDRSKCLSRKIGAVLVKDDSVIGTGYNGPPRGVPHCDRRDCAGDYTDYFVSSVCPRQRMGFKSGEGTQFCAAVHAERNCLMQAAKLSISTLGATLYAYCPIPCPDCAKELINSGVKRIVCLPGAEYYEVGLHSIDLFKFAGITVDIITVKEINEKDTY